MPDQIHQQVEHLRLDRNRGVPATDPVARRIDGVFGYLVFHVSESLPKNYAGAMQRCGRPATVDPLETTATGESPHADATANPAGSHFPDSTGAVRSLDTAGSAVPRPRPAPRERLEDPGTAGLRPLFLSVVLPATALGRPACPVPALQPGIAQPVRRGRHRRADL